MKNDRPFYINVYIYVKDMEEIVGFSHFFCPHWSLVPESLWAIRLGTPVIDKCSKSIQRSVWNAIETEISMVVQY